jgi:hypothetical protein
MGRRKAAQKKKEVVMFFVLLFAQGDPRFRIIFRGKKAQALQVARQYEKCRLFSDEWLQVHPAGPGGGLSCCECQLISPAVYITS